MADDLMGNPDRTVTEAAGGVLWRPAVGGQGVEVALVHRPKYDDWSLPKGKLSGGEHVLVGALREIEEETGFTGVVGRPLGETRYLKDSTPKRVRYWAVEARGGAFAPSDEVDQLMWLPPREGQRHLLADRDRPILAQFARLPEPTWACVLLRHGSAGERSEGPADDRERPLDVRGHEQAAALVPVLRALGIRRVLSADVLRCLDTVGPFAESAGLPVESEPLLSETGAGDHPDAALERLLPVVASRVPFVACTQRKALPRLLEGLCRELGAKPPDDPSARKGGFWAMHAVANGKPRLVDLERFPPVS